MQHQKARPGNSLLGTIAPIDPQEHFPI